MTCFRLKNGETLYTYCRKNNYVYSNIFQYLDKTGCSVEEAIQHYKARRGRKDNHCKYVYKGVNLIAYLHDMTLYNKVTYLIRRGVPIDKAIKEVKRKNNAARAQI